MPTKGSNISASQSRGSSETPQRVRVEVQGVVQGVGFRPFVHRLATSLGLQGWVQNSAQGVVLEVEGSADAVTAFVQRLSKEKPAIAEIHRRTITRVPLGHESGFAVLPSVDSGEVQVAVLADLATCPECLAEIKAPDNRRHAYPFTNCTQCGPRFSILERLPYDRPHTSMHGFAMCATCAHEYHDPQDRRFHAQPNACPSCGPQLALWSRSGAVLSTGSLALAMTAQALAAGQILAVKGLGGFQLLVNAQSEQAVATLRQRKARPHKPLAVMVSGLEQAVQLCHVSERAAVALSGVSAPIVLLPRHDAVPLGRDMTPMIADSTHGALGGAPITTGAAPSSTVGTARPYDVPPAAPGRAAPAGTAAIPMARAVTPCSPTLGIMLPYTPLHHLLLATVPFPLVATSGNLSDEPLCIDEHEAISRLGKIADLFLVHNRPILRPLDDSVAFELNGEVRLLRRARGFAPLPLTVAGQLPPLLAVGGHLKAAVAASRGNQVVLSQHLGDLETLPARRGFVRSIVDLLTLHRITPKAIAHDLHPDYASTIWAEQVTAGQSTKPGIGHGGSTAAGTTAARDATQGRADAMGTVAVGLAGRETTVTDSATGRATAMGWADEEAGTFADSCLVGLRGLPLVPVQHHHAHLVACLGENHVQGEALGVIWDGAGHGLDGSVWGGEFLVGDARGFVRRGSLWPFVLLGGEAAAREPRRAALAVLWQILADELWEHEELPPVRSCSPADRALFARLLGQPTDYRLPDPSAGRGGARTDTARAAPSSLTPLTSSAGRLFDAVAALLGIAQHNTFEGHAAMALEAVMDRSTHGAYPISIGELTLPSVGRHDLALAPPSGCSAGESILVLDWRPTLLALLADMAAGVVATQMATRFHNAMVAGIVEMCTHVAQSRVALAGGCFQNRYLAQETARLLVDRGFEVVQPRQVPPNDGGLCLGQILVAAAHMA